MSQPLDWWDCSCEPLYKCSITLRIPKGYQGNCTQKQSSRKALNTGPVRLLRKLRHLPTSPMSWQDPQGKGKESASPSCRRASGLVWGTCSPFHISHHKPLVSFKVSESRTLDKLSICSYHILNPPTHFFFLFFPKQHLYCSGWSWPHDFRITTCFYLPSRCHGKQTVLWCDTSRLIQWGTLQHHSRPTELHRLGASWEQSLHHMQ